MSTLIIGLLLVTSMNTAGYATRSQLANKDRARAKMIANAMLAEIVELPYLNPDGTPVFGPESGETRATFDDVDDYHNLSDAPPVDKQGTALAGGSQLTRSVTVNFAEPDNFSQTAVTDKGVKRITVTVTGNGSNLAQVTAVVVK
ncbi:MAG: hypothetical protein O3C40_02880 [Planctomycetota bacterium]|nr:hypothetical protein [Planctomycetota bacterium]